jgi:hypothetical protein
MLHTPQHRQRQRKQIRPNGKRFCARVEYDPALEAHSDEIPQRSQPAEVIALVRRR